MHEHEAVLAVRNPTHPVVIDLPDDGHDVPLAILHPDGGLVILSVRAHRGSLTAILPSSGVVREVEGTGEVVVAVGSGSCHRGRNLG